MGECKGSGSSLTFNGSVRIVGRDERLSSSAGLLLVRELDERWAIVSRLAKSLVDPRRASRVTWTLSSQLRRRLYALVAGLSSQRDAASLAGDPIVRLTTSDRRGSTPLLDSAEISQPTLARMHRMLGREENQRALSDSLFELGWRVIRNAAKASEGAHTIDVDSMPIMSHGQQPGSVWNAYYGGRCFHPLMGLHGETGTMLAARLRPGNVQSAEDARSFVLDLVERFEQQIGEPVTVRGDAGFANGPLLTALEERGTRYIFHFGLNPILKRMAAPYLELSRVCSSEPRESVYSLTYPGSRRSPVERRVILVVQETPGELYPHYFFLVTNDRRSKPETVLERYRQRGTSESRFGELKSRLDPKLSCTSNKGDAAREDAWRANASTFLLYMIADGLLHALRWISKKELSSDGESLPRLQRVQRLLIDVAARVTRSARRIHVQVAESASDAWVRLLSRIGRLSPVT